MSERCVDMTCKKHPKYLGCAAPRVDCLKCWKIYAQHIKDSNAYLVRMEKKDTKEIKSLRSLLSSIGL